MVAAELVDTTRLYARTIAQIQPEWLERVGAHLLKKSYGEPRWEKRGAQWLIVHEHISAPLPGAATD